jgi:integrase
MHSNASQRHTNVVETQPGSNHRSHRRGIYTKALDGRKRPIRGLWVRNGHYYARLTVQDPKTGKSDVRRVRLEKATTVAQAQDELRRLKTRREDNDLPAMRRCPKFCDYYKEYLKYYETVIHAKRPRTLYTEKIHLKAWEAHLGETRLDHITPSMINAFIAKRQGEGVTGRTVNLGVVVLRNVLNRAIQEGWIKRLPTENLKPLKWTPRRKELVSLEDINRMCECAGQPLFSKGDLAQAGQPGRPLKNAQEFADYVRLMAFCGSRMTETLALKWKDVDWDRRQLIIGSDGLAKNGKSRVVDFNPHLETHLRAMDGRRAPDSEWLFPSPQRGTEDLPSKTFRESLLMARKAAKMPRFGFHDCRHFFVSYCVMAGIDYMTVAKWLGHNDGGFLIGKVYGHLANEHARRMAQKITFETPAPKSNGNSPDSIQS